LKLVVELDGGYHDYVYEADKERQEFLEAEGYHVARFSNEDVLRELEAVVEGIRQVAVKLRKLTE
jgi:very-short-patch-repair endonuclease